MKRHYILECEHSFDFVVLAINSHSKAYKLCWKLNLIEGVSFALTDAHRIDDDLFVNRYKSHAPEGVKLNLLSNLSKKGYLIPSQKTINYFLIISTFDWNIIKNDFLIKLKSIDDILLVYEFDLQKEKNCNRFIIYD